VNTQNDTTEAARSCVTFYIGGRWVQPAGTDVATVINPSTEQPLGTVAMGSGVDVDAAAEAARAAFATFSQTPVEGRIALLERISNVYEARRSDLAAAISDEIGAPTALAEGAQTAICLAHLRTALAALREFRFEERRGSTLICREPIGVCGLITPWNWPIGQIASKVIPALAAGCTVVLKPSELSPFSSQIFAEVLDAAGVPPGVFNLVHGRGPDVGAAIAKHESIDMVSFTGSTRAGIEVARNAAVTVKRVSQELGGKSPNLILPCADLVHSVEQGVRAVMRNSGQSCNAPTRMLVPRDKVGEVQCIARQTAERLTVGAPGSGADIGPVISAQHWNAVQRHIECGIAQGATLVTGGLGLPPGLDLGYFVRPTIFGDVMPSMAIFREEIFGPVLCITAYDSVDHAIELANDSCYGLAAYVSAGQPGLAKSIASRLKAGQVTLNGAAPDFNAPFGGYKQSGNGREWGEHGLLEYLETKAVLGAI